MNRDGAEGVAWYCLRTASNHELSAALLLQSRTAVCKPYVPIYSEKRRKPATKSRPSGQLITVDRPLFPGYCLARFDYQRRDEITSTPGVVGILMFGGHAARLEDIEVDQIRLLEKLQAVPVALQIGKKVDIRHGPFRGFRGVIVKEKGELRLVVTLEVLGRAVSVELDREDVKAA